MTTVHHQTLESQIAALEDEHNELRIKGRTSAQAYADSLDERRDLQERIAKLRHESQRMKVAVALHDSQPQDPYSKAVDGIGFALRIALIGAVVFLLAYLFSRAVV